jgi:hypothetical protein
MQPQLRVPDFDKNISHVLRSFYEQTNYTQQRKVTITVPQDVETAKQHLVDLYDQGYGLKVLGRELGFSYTQTRTLFQRLNIPFRTGRNVVTDKVRAFRKELANGDDNPWRDWTNSEKFRHKKMGRGIQGHYENNNGKKVWLRSTWEYIYAKWLDAQGFHWATETTQYILSDGTGYRPDFSITDADGRLLRIVEVKGFFKNRLYKTDLLRNEYNIDIDVVDDISPYTTLGYGRERRLWKALAQ